MIRVSASEWLHGVSPVISESLVFVSTVSKLVVMRFTPAMSSLLHISLLMKENNSFLFATFFRKPLFQSRFGTGVLPSSILVRGPFPRRCCVRPFRLLSSGYVSHTASMRWTLVPLTCDFRNGMIWNDTYSLNVFALVGRTRLSLQPYQGQQPLLV